MDDKLFAEFLLCRGQMHKTNSRSPCVRCNACETSGFLDELIKRKRKSAPPIGLFKTIRKRQPETTPKKHFNYVYLIGDGEYVKIGFSSDVLGRLTTLQSGYPKKLQLLSFVRGDRSIEKNIHRLLLKHRCEREWFRQCDEVIKMFNEVKARIEKREQSI
jgi:hypothetical protein